MSRALRVLVVLFLSLFGLAGVAGAQDGPAIELDPESVEEAGTYDVTVRGSGFTIDVFVLQCPGAGGSLTALEEGDPNLLCDLGNLGNGSPDADGNFEVTFTEVEITDCGLVIAAGDIAQTEVAAAVITVENPADDVECEVVEGEGYVDVAGEGAEAGADGDLAETGSSIAPLLLIAVGAILFGVLVASEARRLMRVGAD